MKFTLSITQQCNLRCRYCYIEKKDSVMSNETAERIVEFIYNKKPPGGNIDIGFFGGEPLLEFGLVRTITAMIIGHPSFDEKNTTLSLVTNGTLVDSEVLDFLKAHGIELCISCDGPPHVQDADRRFHDDKKTSPILHKKIEEALKTFPSMLVNAVYSPRTIKHLNETVEYFNSLGVRRIFLSADYSAGWSESDLEVLRSEYEALGRRYVDYYLSDTPRFINIIDNKIILMLRGGCEPQERCSMGKGEFAFAPSGNIYPCERLIGADKGDAHCIGNVRTGLDAKRMCSKTKSGGEVNPECLECGISDYCMNWCGCSNYFASGYYNRVSPFQCASEQAAVKVAFDVFKELEEKKAGTFVEHLSGRAFLNALKV